MQDVLGYGSDCRMNQPGVAGGNWSWRFQEHVLTQDLAQALRSTCEVYGRDKARMEEKENDQADT
jgi:4-alpha-glucanotransferase